MTDVVTCHLEFWDSLGLRGVSKHLRLIQTEHRSSHVSSSHAPGSLMKSIGEVVHLFAQSPLNKLNESRAPLPGRQHDTRARTHDR